MSSFSSFYTSWSTIVQICAHACILENKHCKSYITVNFMFFNKKNDKLMKKINFLIMYLWCRSEEVKVYIWVISCEIYPQNFFSKKYVLSRSIFKNNWHVFLLFQCDAWKFQEMKIQNFEIGKNDGFLIGNSEKSFGFSQVVYNTSCSIFLNIKIVQFYKQLSFFFKFGIIIFLFFNLKMFI